MKKYLGNDKLIIRFFSLYALGLVIFFISWTISYFFLPEGLLRGFGPLARLAGDTAADTQYQEFFKTFILNSFGFLIIVIGNYILRVKYFSFGYLIPLAFLILAIACFREVFMIVNL